MSRSMGLPFWDDPGGPCVKPYSRMHGEESFLKNDIILNLLDLTIICLFLTILLLDMNFKLIAPRNGKRVVWLRFHPIDPVIKNL